MTKRVLFVNSQMLPFVPESRLAKIGRALPQGIQEHKKEIRTFMPRYGCINERKNQLHEVIRLSGMNIIISDVDRPLVIKVASIQSAHMQVYFIDNEDYFKRRETERDADGTFFADNDERAIFYAKGVLETVKKLRWAPDIIHCQGWITHLVPVYLKKVYKDDPIFSGSKVVLSLYSDPTAGERFSSDFQSKVALGAISPADVDALASPDGTNLAKTALRYSDAVILGDPDVGRELSRYAASLSLPVLQYNEDAMQSGRYISDYNDFYDTL